ncbi:MAG: glycoside hydrolase family 3 C-terminal domain-containing protein [Lachnospiraceae bacterium]|nr:glycoside hydrolase family 3 C-terminal domain-containing protein [Lachnospiraceae bacterium]
MKQTLNWKTYERTARQMSAEGCVLLKNDGHALPILKEERVSVFGRTQFDIQKSGTGSGGMVNAPYVTNLYDSLKQSRRCKVNEKLAEVYRKWREENPFDVGVGWAAEPWCQKEMPVTEQLVREAAEESDIAVIILGRTAGEDKDNSGERGSFLLTKEEEALLKQVCSVFKRTAVVLNVGNIIDMSWVEKYNPQAVLYMWQGGAEGGRGAADVLTGKVNPAGRLTDTIATGIKDYPSTANFGSLERNYYAEDIYVGYRYFESTPALQKKVLYPFGFGLSYTDFSVKTDSLEKTAGKNAVTINVTVKNTGKTAGKHSVLVYVEKPQGKLGQPSRCLVCFGKTRVLAPGESQQLTLKVGKQELASFDDSGVTKYRYAFLLEEGTYTFYVGGDVRSAKKAGSLDFSLEKVRQLSDALAPKRSYERLALRGGRFVKEETPLKESPDRLLMEKSKTLYKLSEGTKAKGKKILLKDVRDKKATMEAFLAQLSDHDLACLTRGEGMCSPKVTPGTAGAIGGITKRLEEFGIPALCCADGPSGIRMDSGAMAFPLPNGTSIASSFNAPLATKLYSMTGAEMRINQVDVLLGPGLNMHRSPLNGRNFEYCSEDPYLTGVMAVAMLKGFHKAGVTGCIKHFVGNDQESGRSTADSVISARALREIYLKPFEMAVKQGKAYCIMSTYGPVNGIWTAGNIQLLTDILRNEWHYDGLVMTDWWTKVSDGSGKVERNFTSAMVRAQNDVYMCNSDADSNSNDDDTETGLAEGRITRAELLRNAANICSALMKTPAMKKVAGETEPFEEIHRPEGGSSIAEPLATVEIKEDITSLPLKGFTTRKGDKNNYRLLVRRRGNYTFAITYKLDSRELAQVPVTVYINNHVKGVITMRPTGGKSAVAEVTFDVAVSVDNYAMVYFSEGGAAVEKLEVKYAGGFTWT